MEQATEPTRAELEAALKNLESWKAYVDPFYLRCIAALLERAEDSERLGWLLTSLDFGRFCEQYGTNLQTSRATGTEKEWRAAIDDARQKEAADGK